MHLCRVNYMKSIIIYELEIEKMKIFYVYEYLFPPTVYSLKEKTSLESNNKNAYQPRGTRHMSIAHILGCSQKPFSPVNTPLQSGASC